MPGDQHRPPMPLKGRVKLDTLDALDSLRPSSMPPELGELDFNWDDDLANVVQPRPVRPVMSKLELDLELEEGDRPTAVPEIPMEEFVANAMAAVDLEERALTQSHPIDELATTPGGSPYPAQFAHEPSAFPPTLPSNRASALSAPIPGLASIRSVAPLAVDLAEIEIEEIQSITYLTPTEPPEPELAASDRPTIAPTEAARARQAVSAAAAAAVPSAPLMEPNSRAAMKDRYAMGDFSGALEIAESLLQADSADLDAQRYATSCRDVLTQMYLSRLGGLQQVISVVLRPEELRWLNLDHRAGFLLSLVDGASTIEELLDISGMPRLDALKILATLREQRAILLGSR